LGGGTLLIKAGTYNISTHVTLINNITILGEGIGKTILSPTSAITGQDIFTIGSNLGTSSGSNPPGTYTKISFLNLEFDLKGIGGTAIALYGTSGVNIENIYVHDGIRYGIYFAGCDYVYVLNSRLINFTGNATYACVQFKGVQSSWCVNNYLYNNCAGTGEQGFDSHATDGVNARIGAHNHITNNYIGLCAQGINNEDANSIIADNIIESVAGQYGISLLGSSTFPVVNTIIANNIINGTSGTSNNTGISLANLTSNASNVKIIGNQVMNINSSVQSDGIVISNASNLVVQNNSVKNSGRYGIFVRVSSSKIIGNNVYDDQGTATQQYGIFIDNAITDTYIANNSCKSNINDGIRLFSANSNTRFIGNECTNNVNGIRFLTSTNNNCLIVGNYFTSNTANVTSPGSVIGTGTISGNNFGF
jgi:parallel beta-helix repeat protein